MVDVGAKPVTPRRAAAQGWIRMSKDAFALVRANRIAKGDVLPTAELAGIAGAKRTAELIPLCHPLPLDAVDVRIEPEGEQALAVVASASATWRTGVEMEALTAAAVAALTLVDMLKAVEKTLVVTDLRLLEKSGGRSGDWRRPERA
jgi:cyclic pyranopterin phosphate synthase